MAFEILLICGKLPVPNDERIVAKANRPANQERWSRRFI